MSIHADDEYSLRIALESELDDVLPSEGLAGLVIARHRKIRRRRVASAVSLVVVAAGIGVPLSLSGPSGKPPQHDPGQRPRQHSGSVTPIRVVVRSRRSRTPAPGPPSLSSARASIHCSGGLGIALARRVRRGARNSQASAYPRCPACMVPVHRREMLPTARWARVPNWPSGPALWFAPIPLTRYPPRRAGAVWLPAAFPARNRMIGVAGGAHPPAGMTAPPTTMEWPGPPAPSRAPACSRKGIFPFLPGAARLP